MPDRLAGLTICFEVAALMGAIAILIRSHGPRGWVNGVDGSRVADIDGLGQFTSMMLIVFAALVAAFGCAHCAFGADPATANALAVVFVATTLVITLAILVGIRRFQDKPLVSRDRDGHR
jgi:hypothetical protein